MRWIGISHTKPFTLGIAVFCGLAINQAVARADALNFAQRNAENALRGVLLCAALLVSTTPSGLAPQIGRQTTMVIGISDRED